MLYVHPARYQLLLAVQFLCVVALTGTTPYLSAEEVSPIRHAVGEAFLAKAELCLMKGELNRGKLYLSAAHAVDSTLPILKLKAMDMMYKDFPYLPNKIPGYRSRPAVFSQDGRYLAYLKDRKITRLDLDTGAFKVIPPSEIRGMSIVKISPKGTYIVTHDAHGGLALYDMTVEKVVGQYSLQKERSRGQVSIRMSFSPDEKMIAVFYTYSDQDGVYFLRTEDMSLLKVIPTKNRRVNPLKFLQDGSLVLGLSGRCQVVDPSTLQPIKILAPKTGWDFDYLPSKKLIAVGSTNRIEVFHAETQEKVAEYLAASHNITQLRFLGDGRYLVYASPKGESGVIDCASGLPLQVFNIGDSGATISTSQYLMLTRGKVIDLSACRPYEGILYQKVRSSIRQSVSDIPEAVRKALADTAEKAIISAGGSIMYARKSASSDLEAYGTRDGRTFIYDRKQTKVQLLLTDHYRTPIDYAFLPDQKHFIRLCKSGNGMVGAVESYSLLDGSRDTLLLQDPPAGIAISEEIHIAVILDMKNRVLLSTLPRLDTKVELLGATRSERQIFIDQTSNTLVVKTGDNVDAYDLNKVSGDTKILPYEEAVKRYGMSLIESDSLWSLIRN